MSDDLSSIYLFYISIIWWFFNLCWLLLFSLSNVLSNAGRSITKRINLVIYYSPNAFKYWIIVYRVFLKFIIDTSFEDRWIYISYSEIYGCLFALDDKAGLFIGPIYETFYSVWPFSCCYILCSILLS